MGACACGRTRRALLAAATAVLASCLVVAAPAVLAGIGHDKSLTHIDDLRLLAKEVAAQRRPLLLFFSTPGCPFCLEVRRNYLAPRLSGAEASQAVIREIDITSARTFIGLDGQPIRESDFARQYNVRFVPHVRLVDERLRLLAEPLIGIDAAGFYETRLAGAIGAAGRRMKGR